MIYKDFPGAVKRIIEVKEFKIQAIVLVAGIFLALLSGALLGGKFWLLIEAVSIIILGILVLISKRSLVNIAEYGPMEEVSGSKVIGWGVFYLIFGVMLSLFYFFT